MSTKIYYGYRLAKGTNIWEFTERLRREGNAERDLLDNSVLASLFPSVYKEGETRQQTMMRAYTEWRKVMDQLKDSRLGDPHQLDVTFIWDEVSGRILALLYAGSKIQHIFTDQPEVEYFGYWDNTDPDEDCTEEEWLEREETWDRCLGWDAPIRRGLNFTLRSDATDGMIDLIYSTTEDKFSAK